MGKKNNRGVEFSATFKQDAVNYYHSSGKTLELAAKDLKISRSALARWAREASRNNGEVLHRGSGNFQSDADKEIARLKKELRDSKDALDILKKAISILND